MQCIEGIPLITRFKTYIETVLFVLTTLSIEGIPLITRFKTIFEPARIAPDIKVLKVFHL